MRVLITGAGGFIGSQLTRLLVQEKAEVYALLRPQSDPWRIRDLLPNLKVVEGDLLHPEQGWLGISGIDPSGDLFSFRLVRRAGSIPHQPAEPAVSLRQPETG